MKAIALLAPLLLSALLLVPFAAAAFTITVSTDKTSYVGSATIHVSGTVSGGTIPAGTSVSIQIKNPQNTLVDAGTAPVDPATGAYSKDFVAGGPAWSVAGVYTVTVSWAPDINTPPITQSTVFSYTPSVPPPPLPPISVQVSAAGPLYPGQKIFISALVQFNNGSLVDANFTVVHVFFPNGTLINLATLVTPVKIHKGFFAWSFPLDSKAPDGVYMVHVGASVTMGGSTVTANGLSSFVVNSQIASSSGLSQLSIKISNATSAIMAALNSTASSISSKVDSAVSSLTSIINGAVSSISSKIDSAVASLSSAINGAVSSISGKIDGAVSSLSSKIDSAVSAIKGAISDAASSLSSAVNGAVSSLSSKIDSAVSSLTGAVNSAVSSISSKVDGAVSSLTSTINSAVSSISGKIDSAVSQITSSVGSLSTYIIALIVIAVIVLVLQIVALARRRT